MDTRRSTTARRARPGRPRLTSSPLLAALRRAGTRHVYGDTADPDELAARVVRGQEGILEEVDGNTVNQPLVEKVLRGLLEERDELRRAVQAARGGGAPDEDRAHLYALLCARVGNRMTRAFAAGRRWEVSLQLHMSLLGSYHDALRVGRMQRLMVPNALVKVPFSPEHPETLLVARDLERGGVPVNVTSTFSARQVLVAALLANATRTNVFMGRLEKGLGAGLLGEHVVLQAQRALRHVRSGDVHTQLIVASMHDWRAFERLAGCDAFTAPCDVLGGFLEQEEVGPDDLGSRLHTTYDFRVARQAREALGGGRIARLFEVEPEFVAFLRDLRARPEVAKTTDGNALRQAFEAAGFGDFFHVPSDAEREELAAGKLPDLQGQLVRAVALDTCYSLLANADFERHQAAIDAELLGAARS